MMKNAGKNNDMKEYLVGVCSNGFDVVRFETVNAFSKNDAIEQMSRKYADDDNVVGFQIRQLSEGKR